MLVGDLKPVCTLHVFCEYPPEQTVVHNTSIPSEDILRGARMKYFICLADHCMLVLYESKVKTFLGETNKHQQTNNLYTCDHHIVKKVGQFSKKQ